MKLVHGGRPKRFRINGVSVAVATRETLREHVEIMVFEEDTNLILTVDPQLCFEEVHPIRLMTDIHRAAQYPPGSLVMKGRSWYAVVIDLNAPTMCKPASIEEAYARVLGQIKRQGVQAAAIHLLGAIHGRMPAAAAARLFLNGLTRLEPAPLKMVWLLANGKQLPEVRREIARQIGV